MLCMFPARRPAGFSRTILFAFLFLLPVSPLTAKRWDSAGAARSFEEAERQRAEIEQSKNASLDLHLKCARAYRQVYLKDPHFRGAGEAIYQEGVLYQKAAAEFGSPDHYRTAERRFRLLVKDYPGNARCRDALLRLGEIYTLHLNDETAAEETWQLLAKAYRYSGAALERIRKELASRRTPAAAEGESFVRNIRFWTTADYTRVSIDMDAEAQYEKGRLSNPDRIYLDISKAKLKSDLVNRVFDISDGLLKQVRVGQFKPDVVRVVLDLSGESASTVDELRDPFRIIVDLRPVSRSAAKTVPKPPVAVVPDPPIEPPLPKAAIPTSQGDRTLTRTLGLKIGTIVLDPGHGGRDLGTVGPGGLAEKDLVLSLALSLKKMIEEQLGAEVILTRTDDTFISLEERTAIANRHKADLFISIHANSSRNRSVSGVETYYLDFARNDAEREIAARENATTTSNISDLEDLIKGIARADKSAESRELASIIQNNLHAGARKLFRSTQNRGVRSAPFIVLIGANMPSVLAEVAFISNPGDERLLTKAPNREKLAKALFSGIEAYIKTLGGNVVHNRTDNKSEQ